MVPTQVVEMNVMSPVDYLSPSKKGPGEKKWRKKKGIIKRKSNKGAKNCIKGLSLGELSRRIAGSKNEEIKYSFVQNLKWGTKIRNI